MKKDGGSGRPGDTGPYRKVTAPHNGAVYAVAGSSGQISPGVLNHPAMFISMSNLGSLVLDVTGNRLDVKFIRETGAVDDSFTIVKGTPAAPTEVNARQPRDGGDYRWTSSRPRRAIRSKRGSGTPFIGVGGSTANVFVDSMPRPDLLSVPRHRHQRARRVRALAADLATTIPLTTILSFPR